MILPGRPKGECRSAKHGGCLMSKLALVYHSAHGHTGFIARQVQAGASDVDGVGTDLVKAEVIARTPDDLVGYDGFIFGSPTYPGGVSGPFKGFMDATGRLWRTQQLKGKLAAGFTVSSLLSGDKQSTLLSMTWERTPAGCSRSRSRRAAGPWTARSRLRTCRSP